ncbi:Epoxide hydrolase [Mycena venus]|uniref:Epoxide hydrolase n=1 Tax=Mycena venus TaxID=2733690 RepID=A0A8H6XIL2_9AGAR|nr:Epoxide hydrolase [Mycena venus]
MEQSGYKQTKTKRGLTYSYYFSPPASGSGKPVLLFLHGFPSPSFVWRKQVAFFEPLGYGIVVPDQLGYGGTDKPTDPKLYSGRGFAEDMIDILDTEGIGQVIAIGHDWGSTVLSRLLNYYPQRISACAFFGVGYKTSDGSNPLTRSLQIKEMIGYDVFAYMRFFVEAEAHAVIEKNMDSFMNLLWPEVPESWKESMSVDGGARAWLESNTTTALPSYMTAEDKDAFKTSLLSGGISAPLCWYKGLVEQTNLEDDKKCPPTAWEFQQPLLFVAFNRDFIGLPVFGDMAHSKYAKGPVTREEIDGDHWGVLSHPGELSEMLLKWMGGLNL